MRQILIYCLMQLPGLTFAGGLLYYLHNQTLIGASTALIFFFLWVLKDVLLFFPARKSLPDGSVKDPAGLQGIGGRVEKRLPHERGFLVRVKHELWHAEGSRDLEPGSRVRVVGRQGLVLRIEKIEEP
ncbi:MAG: NfeD family protein [Spirochaetales bacterium]|nr:NfeD family protein [Spirochaetales bacterium]